METVLLFALGAWIVSQMNKKNSSQTQSNQQTTTAPVVPGPTLVPFPYTADGKLIQVSLPYVAPLWKDVVCNDPLAPAYAADLLTKRQNYQDAYDAYILAGGNATKAIRKQLAKTQETYFNTVKFFFTKCKP